MSLKVGDIQKKLPEAGKKNCKECGLPTCFAFAMKLMNKTITIDKCPYLSDEIKAELVDALAPPIRLVNIGKGEEKLSIGEEEVIYRHEKTFLRPPGIAILISDDEPDEIVNNKINKIKELQFDRIGQRLKPNLIAARFIKDTEKYLGIVKRVGEENIPLILISENLDVLFKAQDLVLDKAPLIYPITKDNISSFIPRIKEKPSPVGVKAKKIEEAIEITKILKKEGIEDIVLDTSPKTLPEIIRDYTIIRRAALKFSFRPLGYPIISFPCFMSKDRIREVLLASVGIIKYAGIIVLSDFDKNTLFPLLVLRQNIYSDPRVPQAVEEKIYEIGEVSETSPLLVTTNFALTYFAVATEVEASKIPAYLGVKDTEGLCVLASWATGKFTGETIGTFIKKSGIEDKIKHRRIILPGLAARIKSEVEEELNGWEVIIGPKEASELPSFLPQFVEKYSSVAI
jgi:acetyl-CoA decarbonylase/synthase complex subunit gamma